MRRVFGGRNRAMVAMALLWMAVATAFVVAQDPAVPPLAEGRFVYERNCLVCHGRWGDGRGEMAEGMFPKPRSFKTGIFKHHSTPAGYLPTDEDLRRDIRSGLAGTSMPAFQQLGERELAAVIAYIKSFSPRWRNRANHAAPVKIPERPEWWSGDGFVARQAAGGRTFATACAPCHGAKGDGRGASAPTLEDDWGQPCVPADLRQRALRAGPEPEDLVRVLLTGISGTPMPSYAESYTGDQLWELAAFVESIRVAGPVAPGSP